MTTKNVATNDSSPKEEKSTAEKVVESTQSTAKAVASKAVDQARAGANAAKHSVADEVSGVASALRTAAEEMRNGSPQERSIGQIAESLADASDAIRDKDLGDVMRDVNDVARRNPVLFLGGAALLGFAATRFAKASRSAAHTDTGNANNLERQDWQNEPAAPLSSNVGASARTYDSQTGGAS